jgi:S1-C subfamily serine protease
MVGNIILKKLILITILAISSIASPLPTSSVVKVFVSSATPNYKQPWQTSNRIQVSGSGVIIKDNYIITNAHVVSNAKFVQVSKNDKAKRYIANVKYISNQADLALLEIKDKTFFNDTKPLKLTEDVKTSDTVTVLGYPIGGTALSTTKGVISRIEMTTYTWSDERILAIQIDASINSGNSGGAAINDKDEIVGIVMQAYSEKVANSIGYIIPSIIVNSFLEDIKDGKVDGYDNSHTKFQRLDNDSLKAYYNLKDNYGVVLNKVEDNEDVLKVDDILLEIEGKKISNDSTINSKYGVQPVRYIFDTKPVGYNLNFKVKRDGEILDLVYTLKQRKQFIYNEYNKNPRYLIFGGLAFAPFTKNYLNAKRFNSVLFETFYKYYEEAKEAKEGVIVQVEKFNHHINESYSPYINMVKSVNGTNVIDFNHFIKLIDESKEKFTVIEFLDINIKYVFDTKLARESLEEIKNIYGISTDRRVK